MTGVLERCLDKGSLGMSRFVNLELGGESEERSPQRKALVKDEAYYRAEAKSAFENGDFEPALRMYSKVLEFNPNEAEAWTGQVRMLIELGQHEEARLWADKALERFPRDAELLAAKAVALARCGDTQGAPAAGCAFVLLVVLVALAHAVSVNAATAAKSVSFVIRFFMFLLLEQCSVGSLLKANLRLSRHSRAQIDVGCVEAQDDRV